MNIEELRKSEWKYILLMSVYIAPGLLLLYFGADYRGFDYICSELGVSTENNPLVLSAVSVALMVLGIYFASKQATPRCPHCNKNIPLNNVGIVIATKNCTSCGLKVIFD